LKSQKQFQSAALVLGGSMAQSLSKTMKSYPRATTEAHGAKKTAAIKASVRGRTSRIIQAIIQIAPPFTPNRTLLFPQAETK